MSDYDNTDRGVLFKNKEKGSETHPDYTGSINFGGQDCFLNAWLKKSKSGETYMSLSVKPKGQQKPKAAPKSTEPDFDDSEIPF